MKQKYQRIDCELTNGIFEYEQININRRRIADFPRNQLNQYRKLLDTRHTHIYESFKIIILLVQERMLTEYETVKMKTDRCFAFCIFMISFSIFNSLKMFELGFSSSICHLAFLLVSIRLSARFPDYSGVMLSNFVDKTYRKYRFRCSNKAWNEKIRFLSSWNTRLQKEKEWLQCEIH